MRLRLNGRRLLATFQRPLSSLSATAGFLGVMAPPPSRIGEARRRAADAKQAAAALAAAGFLAIALLARASHPAHASSATEHARPARRCQSEDDDGFEPPAGTARPERAAPRAARRRASRDRRGRHRVVRGSGGRDARLPAAQRLGRRRASAVGTREAAALAAVRARGRAPLPRHPRRDVHRRSTAAALLLDHVVPFSLGQLLVPGAAATGRSGSPRGGRGRAARRAGGDEPLPQAPAARALAPPAHAQFRRLGPGARARPDRRHRRHDHLGARRSTRARPGSCSRCSSTGSPSTGPPYDPTKGARNGNRDER